MTNDIGFQYGKFGSFSDQSLATSSSQFDKNKANPVNGRLYTPWKFWCPKISYKSSYLELILVKKFYIFAATFHGQISDEGRQSENFTMDISILYSNNYAEWEKYDKRFKVSCLNHRLSRRQSFSA